MSKHLCEATTTRKRQCNRLATYIVHCHHCDHHTGRFCDQHTDIINEAAWFQHVNEDDTEVTTVRSLPGRRRNKSAASPYDNGERDYEECICCHRLFGDDHNEIHLGEFTEDGNFVCEQCFGEDHSIVCPHRMAYNDLLPSPV